MGKSTYKPENIANSDRSISQETINRILVDKDIMQLQSLLKNLSTRYNLSPESLTGITKDLNNIQVPTSIYSDENISMLESTVKYLKEELNLKFSQISSILNRDERTIWATYHNSLRKTDKKSQVFEGILIPLRVLKDRRYSILEQAVGFLKETHEMRFSEIGNLLRLDQRTIWTCYNRLKNKRGGKNEAK